MSLKRRHIQPGYSEGLCSTDYVEKVNCAFANQVYAKYLKEKWGVDACIEDNYDKWFIKKQLLDMNLIYDPNMCIVVCDNAEAPCGVNVSVQISKFITCNSVEDIQIQVEFPTVDCIEPDDVETSLEYQGIR